MRCLLCYCIVKFRPLCVVIVLVFSFLDFYELLWLCGLTCIAFVTGLLTVLVYELFWFDWFGGVGFVLIGLLV